MRRAGETGRAGEELWHCPASASAGEGERRRGAGGVRLVLCMSRNNLAQADGEEGAAAGLGANEKPDAVRRGQRCGYRGQVCAWRSTLAVW